MAISQTVHHSGYYNLVFGTTIPTFFNILMKCFLHFNITHLPPPPSPADGETPPTFLLVSDAVLS